MKACIVCGVELTDGNWAVDQKANWINKCRECIKQEKREYQKRWRDKNPGAASARANLHRDKLRAEHPVKYRARMAYSDSRKRAAKMGFAFDLTARFVYDAMLAQRTCPYFHWPLSYGAGKPDQLASIDRVDSTKGYTRDNVQIVSYLANLMKSNATLDHLKLFAQGVLLRHGGGI